MEKMYEDYFCSDCGKLYEMCDCKSTEANVLSDNPNDTLKVNQKKNKLPLVLGSVIGMAQEFNFEKNEYANNKNGELGFSAKRNREVNKNCGITQRGY